MSDFYLKIKNELCTYIMFIAIPYMQTRVITNDDNSDILHLAHYQEQPVFFKASCRGMYSSIKGG